MARRTNYAFFVDDDTMQRLDEDRPIEFIEFIRILFPPESNKKQFDAGKYLMEYMLVSKKEMHSREDLKGICKKRGISYPTLYQVVIPKLRQFGLIDKIGVGEDKKTGRGKSFMIKLSNKYSIRLRRLANAWTDIVAYHKG